MSTSHEPSRVRSAIFVDFDNIYLGLQERSPQAAKRFATEPDRWLEWITATVPDRTGQRVERDFLVRRCYLNPGPFSKYRVYYTRSAFSVVDCPSLTGMGKNSADIYMVLDVLDTLRNETRIDEFVILSADADFTPVLLRLRLHDRRTAVLASGPASAAYRAASDITIDEEEFVEAGLGVRNGLTTAPAQVAMPAAARAPLPLLGRIAERVCEEASALGELSGLEMLPILREFREFTPTCNWLGFYSLRALTTELVGLRSELRIVEGDPWRIALLPPTVVPMPDTGEAPAPAIGKGERPAAALESMRSRAVEVLRNLVRGSAEPVMLPRAAQEVIAALGAAVTESRWFGYDTFKALLQATPGLGLEFATDAGPGFLWDPALHAAPVPGEEVAPESVSPELADFIRRVNRVTGVPRLWPEQFRELFKAMSKELAGSPFDLTNTSKRIRDQAVERGIALSRHNSGFILKGIQRGGHPLGESPDGEAAEALARAFLRSVQSLAEQAQMELTSEEEALLADWLAPQEGGRGEPRQQVAPRSAQPL